MTGNYWIFSERSFNDVEQEVTEADQFNTETVPETEALVREATQNSQDAKLRDHGVFARVMLAFPISKQPETLEQLGGQQEAFGARAVVEAADRLYWDPTTNALKRGAQGKKEGTPRRLVRFMRQFRRTFDPPAMTADQLLATLPKEFGRWQPESPVGTP